MTRRSALKDLSEVVLVAGMTKINFNSWFTWFKRTFWPCERERKYFLMSKMLKLGAVWSVKFTPKVKAVLVSDLDPDPL